MNVKIFWTIISLLQFHLTMGQDISLDDLVYFQTTKNSVRIDSVLLTKIKWDCNCLRQFDRIDLVREWRYDIPDSTIENIDKDYIKFIELGQDFSSVIMFYTTDNRKASIILRQISASKMPEERIKKFNKEKKRGKLSFFIGDRVAIQTVIAEDKVKGVGQYIFVAMDKTDYLKDLEIK